MSIQVRMVRLLSEAFEENTVNKTVNAALEQLVSHLTETEGKVRIDSDGGAFSVRYPPDPQVYDSHIIHHKNGKQVQAAAQEALKKLASSGDALTYGKVVEFVDKYVSEKLKKPTKVLWNSKSYPD